jgi:CO/xanthine dehydrogenase Mo-binding subunit
MNGFFAESAINEIAAHLRRDPVELRRERLAKLPRAQAVLDLAVEKSRWREGRWAPAGAAAVTPGKLGGTAPRSARPFGVKPSDSQRGVGIALALGFGSYCAQVVEVSVVARRVTVERIVVAFDCGQVIDPSQLVAQIEGGVIWGLSAARDGEVRFKDGAALPSNFHEAPILRIDQCPRVDVHLVTSDAKPSGAGEASVPPVAPALAAAIYAATGQRPRRLPLICDGWEFA